MIFNSLKAMLWDIGRILIAWTSQNRSFTCNFEDGFHETGLKYILEMGWYINTLPYRNMQDCDTTTFNVSLHRVLQYVYRINRMYWLEQHDKDTYKFKSKSQIIELA